MARARMVKGYLINVETGNFGPVEVDDSNFENYYTLLNIDTYDIVTRTIGGKEYTIVCDDEGLLKESPRISAIDKEQKPMLVGNLFICKTDYRSGNLKSLTDKDFSMITSKVQHAVTENAVWPVLSDVEY